MAPPLCHTRHAVSITKASILLSVSQADQAMEEIELSKPPVWDCGSSLYDSFELESVNRRLDSAISCRSFSMPRLAGFGHGVPLPQPTENRASKRISRHLQKLLRSIFKSSWTNPKSKHKNSGFYFCHSGPLPAIPEARGLEHSRLSPEMSFFREADSVGEVHLSTH